MFDRYIGIDYSGAGNPHKSNEAIAVAENDAHNNIQIIPNPIKNRKWSREDIYIYLEQEFKTNKKRIIAGIDHGFSYPISMLKGFANWDKFLKWFDSQWQTSEYSVAECMKSNGYKNSNYRRLVEKAYATKAKSVVDLDRKVHGMVSYSTHAGIPWLSRLRKLKHAGHIKLHFWPFDGVVIPENSHVLFEAYPSLYKKTVQITGWSNEHERDAMAIVSWLNYHDRHNTLIDYLSLKTLTPAEIKISQLEGWILGCL
ncbi:hypothetical protein PP175_21755 [Aneurinibacillus sp. Ricciae_BoGa-3]|uniref:hypothetical protein n=1 Tax=Aneurinibacillus sp. Ricciae_BoGa-3 TaxID=3022697 RepID=UPI00234139A9|nr:hypothetical protein [Aneurinibacillus sp. Ricciae_BoGa-3]WCK53917.1 hypothetical protein PP175_21755 [Aneurinibacillus sp. Ricciae_BoGa-3]